LDAELFEKGAESHQPGGGAMTLRPERAISRKTTNL
jgi:hypothetical protein